MQVSLEELKTFAAQFVAKLARREDSATMVTLSGELGAGKTTFAQGIAHALGVEETVTSPTYVIEKIYPIRDASRSNGASPLSREFKRLIHIDAYRLNGAHELEVLGWKELLQEQGNLIVLEWPEKVAAAVPENAIRITLTGSGDTREISYGEN